MKTAVLQAVYEELEYIGLYEHQNFSYGAVKRSEIKRMTYAEAWDHIISKGAYDFRLSDNSLLSFDPHEYGENEPRYAYYPCPFNSLSYKEYLEKEGHVIYPRDIHLVGDSYRDDYEQYIRDCDLKRDFPTMRFDVTSDSYSAGRHPLYHLHIGYDNDIRIGLKRKLSPLAFLHLLFRQYYSDLWELLLSEKSDSIINHISELVVVETEYLLDRDKCELYLDFP